MVTILISWITIFYILFSLGNIFTFLYNKLCKNEEKYNILDTFVLGICFTAIILPLSSLWLPSNEYILFTYIIISTVYWIFNRSELNFHIEYYKKAVSSISISQKIFLGLSILSILIYVTFLSNSFDAEFYHYQNIRWNEEYSVIPGLGNIEDRFGFNSNYLLFSAVFSFRFLFDVPVYTIQSALFVLMIVWAFIGLYKSQYNINYIILLVCFLILFLTSDSMLDNSSTDIIPLLCIFYYLAKTTLHPDWLTKQPLMAFLLPITLVTFKLSTIVFCLVSFGIMIYLIKQKKSRILYFLLSTTVLTITLWCIRNVIITGYLIYPLSEIDLFSFDWKVPKATAILQKEYIGDWADLVVERNSISNLIATHLNAYKINLLSGLINWSIFVLVAISPVFVIYSLIKKNIVNKNIYYIYLVSIICLVFGIRFAPDPRFINGYLIGCLFLLICLMLILIKKEKLCIGKGKNIIALAIALCFMIICVKKKQATFSYMYNNEKDRLSLFAYRPIYHPWSSKADLEFTEYPMNGITIYLTKSDDFRTFDRLPATNSTGIPFTPFDGNKVQNIKTIKARGFSIQQGFRTKKEYTAILNRDIEKYKSEYEIAFKRKIGNTPK